MSTDTPQDSETIPQLADYESKKSDRKQSKTAISDLIDELLALPEEHVHLCSALMDDGSKKEGYIRFLLNREVMDIYRDIIDELENARVIPDNAHPATLQITDDVIVFLIQNDPDIWALKTDDEKLQVAREKASGYYKKQKQQIESDAMLVAMALYNEINLIPIPYKPGEIAFRAGSDEQRARPLPAWMKARENYEIPLPERRLGHQYEAQLKTLHQLVDTCGPLWTLGFRKSYERGIMKVLSLVEPKDDAGFPPKPSGSKVHAKSRAKS